MKRWLKLYKITVDVRELEAPKPLLEAIKAMRNLQNDEYIEFIHRINPCKLQDEASKIGLQTKLISENPYIVLISKDITKINHV